MKRNDSFAIALLILVTSIIVFFTFKPVIENPNNYLFSHGGDAVKSYYNFSYYLKYDEGLKFDGHNYPYGDHVQYINSHPFHSAVCKVVQRIAPIAPYGVSILNLSMILALVLAVPFFFLILRHYKLPIWYSFIVALILLFLSPQLDRIKGHFEMVYLFFIPMFWYFLIKFKEGKKKWLWGSVLVASGIIGGFTSAYFAAFYSIFLLGVLFAEIWFNRKNLKSYIKPGLVLLGMAILPLLAVRGVVSLTDWVDDRPNNPWGFFVFHATPFSVFMPSNSLLKSFLNDWIKISYEWEGRAYVGLPATILALSIVFALFYHIFTKKKTSTMFPNSELNIYLLGATLILAFSMCVPFKYGFGFLLDILPPVKQFRALGRFAWIFYYVFVVYAAYFFYQLYLKLKEKGFVKLPILLLIFVLSFWSVEAANNAKKSFSGIFLPNDKLESSDKEYSDILASANINTDDYQAIFFVPYSNTSGDKLLFEQGLSKAFPEAMRCSYHTGLPLIQSFAPRLSFKNALSSVQMLADSTIRKTRLDDMNNKPILLIYTDQNLSNQEKWLIGHSQLLYNDKRVSLAKIDLSVFTNSHNSWLANVDSIKPLLIGDENLKADVPLSKIVAMNFDDQPSENHFSGQGALSHRRNILQVFDRNFGKEGIVGAYKLSFWMFFDTRIYDMPQPRIFVKDENGKILETIRPENRAIHNVYGNWVLIEQEINIEEGKNYKLEIKGKYVTIDNLLLQPKGSSVCQKFSDNVELFNNFPLDD